MKRVLLAAQVIAVLAVVVLAYTMFGRLGHDCELEWMTGSIYDTIERIRDGKPIYTAPTIDWTPFMYPPLYFEIVAALPRSIPLPIAARSISILATLVQGVCIWRLTKHHGASRAWCIIAVGVFAGAFADTSFWYDLERVDPLFVAMMTVGVTLLVERKGLVSGAIAGAIMGLGFFAKQPAVVFVAAAAAALAVNRQILRAIVYSVPAGVIALGGVAWLHTKTGGWFDYYVLKMPGAHGVVPSLFKQLFFDDVPRAFALVACAVVFIAGWARAWRKKEAEASSGTIFAFTLAAAAFASGSSRVHLGGWDNVLMFFTTFASAAVGVVGSRVSERFSGSRWACTIPVLAGVQIIVWLYDPTNAVPPRSIVREARAFEAKVRAFEKDGEVWVSGRGHVTATRHAHHAALIDVFRTEHRITDEIAAPFRARRFAVVIIDSFDDLQLMFLPSFESKLWDIVLANYYIAERLPIDMPDAPVGYHTHPKFVLRARRQSFQETDREMIRCRAKIERTLAESVERSRRGGVELEAPPDIEALAAQICAKAFGGVKFPADRWPPDDPYWK